MQPNTQPTEQEQQPISSPKPNIGSEASIYLVPGSILVSGIIIAFAIYFSFHGSIPTTYPPTTDQTGQAPSIGINIKDIQMKGEPYIGQDSAPVTIAFWSDFQCPFCKQFELNTLPSIVKEYVDSGKVKIIFKDYDFLGADSDTAGVYARSIWKLYPKQYFAWREAMYKAQDAEGDQGFGDAASIVSLTKTIVGIDATKIQSDVSANTATYQSQNDADKAEGTKLGIQGTPAFVVGTQLLSGALPYSNFKTSIDAELKK